MKVKECEKCGCKRSILLKTKVLFQEDSIQMTFNYLCVPCLLETLNLSSWPVDRGTYNYSKAMEVVAN